jgi:hypothetical protein
LDQKNQAKAASYFENYIYLGGKKRMRSRNCLKKSGKLNREFCVRIQYRTQYLVCRDKKVIKAVYYKKGIISQRVVFVVKT